MKKLLFLLLTAATISVSYSQTSFIDVKSGFRLPDVLSKVEDSLRKQFEKQKLVFPPENIFIRSFKYDRQLEVWVKGDNTEPYKLFKTYRICMQSGTMGPKRVEGDYQVPEGFYHINELKPNSNYHLSLGLNYPNASDKILGDPSRPGNNIYIHGNCVSTGCIAIMDVPVEELYILASYAKSMGQEFIPVHVYPIRYNVKKSADYLATAIKDNQALIDFNKTLRNAYDFFEAKKQLPLILVNKKGEYVIH